MNRMERNFEVISKHFQSFETRFVFDSMLEGNTPAAVYVDKVENPSVSLVWDKGHNFYLGGKSKDRKDYSKMTDFFKNSIINNNLKKQSGIARLYLPIGAHVDNVEETFKEFNPIIYWRSLYKHDLCNVNMEANVDPDISIQEINEDILNDNKLINHQILVGKIIEMWGSAEKFLDKGFGYCAIESNILICWCIANNVSEKCCGVGIETVDEYQGKGIATSTAANFMKRCLKQKVTPHWDNWKNDKAANRVAEKLGFSKLTDYKVVVLRV